jgi:hypothetical protein
LKGRRNALAHRLHCSGLGGGWPSSVRRGRGNAHHYQRPAPLRFPGLPRDKDPHGTNIRAAPNAAARIIGHLPALKGDFGADVEVIGSTGAWFLIRDAAWREYDNVKGGKIFAGPGWIAADLVTFATEDSRVRSGPSLAAPVIMNLNGAGGGPDEAAMVHIHGCSGTFVDVDLKTPDGKTARGWVTQICAHQVTTCGGSLRILEEHDGRLVEPDVEPTD